MSNRADMVSSERSDEFNSKCKKKYCVYLAGPVTGKKDQNREAFAKEAKRLRAKGYWVQVPLEFVPSTASWSEAMNLCLSHLIHCNRVVFLHGWLRSRGARREWLTAKFLRIPTYREGEL